jgi:hypothetical protein
MSVNNQVVQWRRGGIKFPGSTIAGRKPTLISARPRFAFSLVREALRAELFLPALAMPPACDRGKLAAAFVWF